MKALIAFALGGSDVPVARSGPIAVPVQGNTWTVIAGLMGELTRTSIWSIVAEVGATMPKYSSPPETSGNDEFGVAEVLKEKHVPGALLWAKVDVKTTTKPANMRKRFIGSPRRGSYPTHAPAEMVSDEDLRSSEGPRRGCVVRSTREAQSEVPGE